MPTCETARRLVTEAARAAAALARQRERERETPVREGRRLVSVVVLAADGPRGFARQIRRFGRMQPVAQSAGTSTAPGGAGRSGQALQDGMRGTLGAHRCHRGSHRTGRQRRARAGFRVAER